ncbi:MAG: dockerin type I repeat-containing protein, partial [Ruminococcus sp.]|nr:dockerin type I repeat-containing protein [Ruminococcus sp.]
VDGAGAYWESIQKVTAETGWQEVKIPFSDFHVQQWGTAAETPTLQGVSEFSIYTGQNGNPGTGVWYFDDIGLYQAGSTTTTTTTTTGTTTTTTTTTTTAETTSMETEATTISETTTTDADTDTSYGDVNLDGKVDLVDAITINKYLAGQITLSEQATKNADVNADGSLGDGDSTILMRFILMMIPNLPYVE